MLGGLKRVVDQGWADVLALVAPLVAPATIVQRSAALVVLLVQVDLHSLPVRAQVAHDLVQSQIARFAQPASFQLAHSVDVAARVPKIFYQIYALLLSIATVAAAQVNQRPFLVVHYIYIQIVTPQ